MRFLMTLTSFSLVSKRRRLTDRAFFLAASSSAGGDGGRWMLDKPRPPPPPTPPPGSIDADVCEEYTEAWRRSRRCARTKAYESQSPEFRNTSAKYQIICCKYGIEIGSKKLMYTLTHSSASKASQKKIYGPHEKFDKKKLREVPVCPSMEHKNRDGVHGVDFETITHATITHATKRSV